jgi:hypothetical protein
MVEITYLAIIGIALAAMFFGYGFGLFEGRSQGYKKRKAEEDSGTKEKPVPSANPVTVMVDDPGLLRIKNENGLLALDLDGGRVNTSSISPEQRKRLIEMLNLIRPWLEGKTPSASAVPASPPPDPVPAPVVSAPPPAARPVAPPAVSVPKEKSAKDDRPSAPANSIVGQIDAILQEQLAGTPLEEKGVFLTQSPEGGVNVYVGLTRYIAIEDVPDEQIKAAIRAAIAQWEDKYTPGLK